MSYKPEYYKFSNDEIHYFYAYFEEDERQIILQNDIFNETVDTIAININEIDKFIELLQKIREENK